MNAIALDATTPTTTTTPTPTPAPTIRAASATLHAGLARPTRSRGSRLVADTLTMAWRGLLTLRRTPEQFADVTVQPIVFTIMFTFLLGGAVTGDVSTYLPFLVPGIMVQSVLNTSVATGVGLREDMSSGVFERFATMPTSRLAPLTGALLADLPRFLIAAGLTMGVGAAMGYRPGGGMLGVLAAIALSMVCAMALSWIFVFFGIVARSAESVQNLSMMILFLLTFVSNAFVPAATLPGWLQAFVQVNPVTYLVAACRTLADTGAWSANAGWALLGAAAIVAIFAPLAVRRYLRSA